MRSEIYIPDLVNYRA